MRCKPSMRMSRTVKGSNAWAAGMPKVSAPAMTAARDTWCMKREGDRTIPCRDERRRKARILKWKNAILEHRAAPPRDALSQQSGEIVEQGYAHERHQYPQ